MKLDQLALLGLLSASIHWIIARSAIAKPLWSRAKGKFGELLRCAGCSGFWIGLGLWWWGVRPVTCWGAPLATGLLGVVLTPVFEAILLWGLEQSAIDDTNWDSNLPS